MEKNNPILIIVVTVFVLGLLIGVYSSGDITGFSIADFTTPPTQNFGDPNPEVYTGFVISPPINSTIS